jgi:photosystem II stability/assembly factor-like uncharacterized protein
MPRRNHLVFVVLFCAAILAMVVISAPRGISQQARTQRENQEQEEKDLQIKRSEWFYGQRAYPHKYVPAHARLTAFRQLESMMVMEIAKRTPKSPSWKSLGPQPVNTPYTDPVVSGRVTALAINPTDESTIYLAGAQGGVWQTTNAGKKWKSLTDDQPSLAIGSLVLDPANPTTIYAGTGEENFSGDSYYGAGILKSTDGGTTWTQYCSVFCGPVGGDGYYGGGARIGGIAIDPANNQTLLAAVALLNADGIYRSTDGGQTWTQVLSGNPGTAVIFDPTGGFAYAALGNSFSGGTEGVYVSTDGGQTWNTDNGAGAHSLALTNAGRIVMAMAPSSPKTLYAGIANVNDGSLVGMYKTTNGGSTWSALTSTPDYCTPQCSYDNVIAVSPVNPKIIFAGGAFGVTLVRSLDGGKMWSVLQSAQDDGFLHADTHALAFTTDGKKLFLGNDGGAYSTSQVTAADPVFTALNTTLSITQFYPGLSVNSGATFAIGGTQDNGTEIYSGVPAWNQVTCGDGGYTAIDLAAPSTLYATCQEIFIQKSTTGGGSSSWQLVVNGIDEADRVDFIPPLVMDPAQPKTLYFGTYRVYQTTNGAGKWTAISPDLTNGPSFWGVVTSIAVAPTSSNTVYAGTGDSNVQVTTNANAGTGATWTNVTGTGRLPLRVISQVAVDPTVSTTHTSRSLVLRALAMSWAHLQDSEWRRQLERHQRQSAEYTRQLHADQSHPRWRNFRWHRRRCLLFQEWRRKLDFPDEWLAHRGGAGADV